jgi:hypothetical protein
MSDEHDDDLEPEVDVGAEIETQNYAGATDDETAGAGDVVNAGRAAASDESRPADEDEQADDEDEASDTI